jgi:hypothetical protein
VHQKAKSYQQALDEEVDGLELSLKLSFPGSWFAIQVDFPGTSGCGSNMNT